MCFQERRSPPSCPPYKGLLSSHHSEGKCNAWELGKAGDVTRPILISRTQREAVSCTGEGAGVTGNINPHLHWFKGEDL